MKQQHKKILKCFLLAFTCVLIATVGIRIYKFYFVVNHRKVLSLDKKEYFTGEPVFITAIGTEADWVGIYKDTDDISEVNPVYWYYVNDKNHISGYSYDIKKQKVNRDRKEVLYLPEGSYKAVLLYNDSYQVIAEKTMKVKGDGLPSSPTSLEYFIENPKSGLADGKVYVKFSDKMSDITKNISLYWGDDEGILEDYTALAKFKVDGQYTKKFMTQHTMIPEKATRLLAYGNNEYGDSIEYAEYRLPEKSSYVFDEENLIGEFVVLSDTHINENGGSESGTLHFIEAVKDMGECVSDNWGIFIVGDITDTGNSNEYEKMWNIMDAYGNDICLYLTIGNHDLMQETEEEAILFMENVRIPNIYYEKVIYGYHFLFMGSEKSGNMAYFSDNQLQWLQNTLNNCRKEDAKKPVFLFVHQPLYNTVAGSLRGQGWDGVSDENDCSNKLRDILKNNKQVIMFTGHTHWEMNSERTIYKSEELPTILNTASVAYLWSSYDVPEGEFMDGSQGYYVKLYKDKVIVRGRDFLSKKYIPSAMFVCDIDE